MKKYISMFAAAAMAASAIVSCTPDDDTPGGNGGNGTGTGGDGTSGGNGGGIELPASLRGSDYYVIQLGDEEYETLEEDGKIAMSLRIDDQNIFLYVWDATYEANVTPWGGNNFYDFTSGWTSFSVTNVGWSGAAYNLTTDGVTNLATELAKIKKIQADIDNYYLHFAYKTVQTDKAHLITINWAGQTYVFAVGEGTIDQSDQNGNFVKTHTAIAPLEPFQYQKWNEYEIPLKDMGIDFSKDATSENFFQFSSGGAAGTTIDLDAIFIYKK